MMIPQDTTPTRALPANLFTSAIARVDTSPSSVLTGQFSTNRSLLAIGESHSLCDESPTICLNSLLSACIPCFRWFNSDCSRAESFYYLNENKAGALMAMATRLLPKAPFLPSQTSPEKRNGGLLLTAARPTVPSFHEGEPARPSSPRPRHLTSPVAIATPTPFPARHLPKPQPRPLIKIPVASEEAPIRADVRAFLEREVNLKRPKVSSLRAKPTVSSLTFRWRNVA